VTVQRRQQEAELLHEVANESPRDYMLRIMRCKDADPTRRDAMARAAAPYCHAQLQATAIQYLDDKGRPIAPQINVQVMQAPVEAPRLTHEGPKADETVQ
jgi:hypothetical protein